MSTNQVQSLNVPEKTEDETSMSTISSFPLSNSNEDSIGQCPLQFQDWRNDIIYDTMEDLQPTQIRLDPNTGIFTDYALPENHPYREFRLDHSDEESDDDV